MKKGIYIIVCLSFGLYFAGSYIYDGITHPPTNHPTKVQNHFSSNNQNAKATTSVERIETKIAIKNKEPNTATQEIKNLEEDIQHSNLLNEAKVRPLETYEVIYLKDKLERLSQLRHQQTRKKLENIHQRLKKLEGDI